jgi:hypothetical protein
MGEPMRFVSARRPMAVTSEMFYLAICQDCTPVLPQPFLDFKERARWTKAHRDGTGHVVTYEETPTRGNA